MNIIKLFYNDGQCLGGVSHSAQQIHHFRIKQFTFAYIERLLNGIAI